MPSDGSGVYSLDPGYLAVTGSTIVITQHNPVLEDIAAGLSARIMASGVRPMTGPLKLADGTAGAPSLAFASAATYGLYKAASGGIGVAAGGAKVAEFNSSGFTLVDGGDIASAAALTLGTGNIFNITGTTSITSIVTRGIGTIVDLRFNGILTFTHHATNLICTTGASITTAAGDWCRLEEYGTGTWRMLDYARASGDPVKVITQMPATFKNLSIKVASNTTVTVAADFVVTTDGTSFQATAVSSTVNMATTGADALDTGTIAIDTWYAIWVVAKADATTKCIASTSFTSPTMPSGYTYKARVGAVQTIHGSATLWGTWQFGRKGQYVIGLAQTTALPNFITGASGSTSVPTWSAVALARFVPTTASRVQMTVVVNNGSVMVAPSNSYGGIGSASIPGIGVNTTGIGALQADYAIESANIYYAGSSASSALVCNGWEDNI